MLPAALLLLIASASFTAPIPSPQTGGFVATRGVDTAKGGHGFGMIHQGLPVDTWPARCRGGGHCA